MSSDFGGSQQYKYQGQAALSNGRATQAAYEKKARALEAEAVSDSHLAARNMKRMRQNQNAAMGSARAQRGGSGFTSEGSGSQAEVAVADVWESAIGDAALSNAVSDANKRFAAESARYQGDLAMMAARSEADQYKMLSQNALGSAMIQTALTVAGGVMGAAGMSGGGLLGGVTESGQTWGSASGGTQGAFSGMAARSEADQYKMLSQNALGSAMIQTALTVAGGVMGAAGMSGGGLLGGVTESGQTWGSASGGTQGAFSGMMNAYSLSGSLGGMVPGSMQSSNRLRDSLLANFMGFGKR